MLLNDTDVDGEAEIFCPAGTLAEFALLVYPLDGDQKNSGDDLIFDIQLQGPEGWETAAQDILRQARK